MPFIHACARVTPCIACEKVGAKKLFYWLYMHLFCHLFPCPRFESSFKLLLRILLRLNALQVLEMFSLIQVSKLRWLKTVSSTIQDSDFDWSL